MRHSLGGAAALVTGGAKGFGRGVARSLAARGARVWITGRDETSLRAAADELGVCALRADVRSAADWDRVVAAVLSDAGRIDVFVNNAGAAVRVAPAWEQADAELVDAIAVNLTGPMLGCRRVARVMADRRSGTIVNVSRACQDHAWPGWSAYSAAKAGLAQFSECLYTELREYGVRVTTLIPSWGRRTFWTRLVSAPGRPRTTPSASSRTSSARWWPMSASYRLTSPSNTSNSGRSCKRSSRSDPPRFPVVPHLLAFALAAAPVEADLLVVGGNESAVAAAVQAARLGVKRVVLVADTDWLGGQFCNEGVGAVDEWTTVDEKRVEFPRSGLFLEVARAIEARNREKYGTPQPGNCFCARLTIEPREAARIFERLVEPEVRAGRLRVERGWEPAAVSFDGNRVAAVRFTNRSSHLDVNARLTIDASDWGDVIRLGGAKYAAGPDPKSRYGEPSAPAEITAENRREMNPITWCVTLRGADREAVIPEPDGFDPRRYYGASRETQKEFVTVGWPKGVLRMNVPAFADTTHPGGPYSPPVNAYTHRRLVDAVHLGRPFTDECTFLNWPPQDYPLDRWPQRVADELDRTEPGASAKNIVDLTPDQRRIVFADAKRHALGLVHHRQKIDPHFRNLALADEYGTPDRLPPKPYVREGLRLEALAVLREQDLRTPHPEPKWAKRMPADGVFGFQFNIDFHPTRRQFLADDPAGPWATVHTATRNWNTHTDRGTFPLRGLVPVERDGLLGASKNIGVSSIVSSAVRLHGQMMLCGQACATVAAVALRHGVQPRAVAADPARVREVQRQLVRGAGGPGVLVWPYHDLPPDHEAFEAANLATLSGTWRPDPDDVFFRPDRAVTTDEWAAARGRIPAASRDRIPADPPPTRAAAVRALAFATSVISN